MTANPAVAFVGIAIIDKIFGVAEMPAGATKHFAHSHRELVGGVAANAATTAARLGARAHMVGRVGDDDAGRLIRKALERAGVDCKGLVVAPTGATPVSAVFVDPSGNRMLVNHKDPALFAGATVEPAALAGLDAVMCDVRWPDGAAAALALAARMGVPGVLDFDKAPERGAHRLIDRASHVIFGTEALMGLTGGATQEARLERVAARSPGRNFAVTAGEAGVVWRSAGGATGRIAAHAVDAVDTFGAGDAFHGAVSLALAEGRSFEAALRFANAAAAVKVSRPGGLENLPTLAEVEALLEAA